MFPKRYFTLKYWTERYWSKSSKPPPSSQDLIVITKSKSNTFVIPNFNPTPDCFIGFIGKITDLDTDPVGFIGEVTGISGFIGIIAEPLPLESVGFQGLIDGNNVGFSGKITSITAFEGSVCDVC